MKQVFFKTVSGSPDTPEWHTWRSQGIGGSDSLVIASDAGLIKPASWMDTAHALWEHKLGMRPPKLMNPAMKRGRDNEERARLAFEKKSGILVSPAFGEMDDFSFVRSSFDGLSFDHDVNAEIKCPNDRVHGLAKLDEVVPYYRPQLAHQALTVWGHPEGWNSSQRVFFISYKPEIDECVWVEKPATAYAGMAEKLLEAEKKFWASVVAARQPCGESWERAAEIYLQADANLVTAKAYLEKAKEDVIRLLGGTQKREGGGIMAYRSERKGSVDYDALFEELQVPPETIEKHRKPGSESTTVKVVGKKEAKTA